MSELKEKVLALVTQQDVIRESEKKLKMDQVIYQAKLQDVLKCLGFEEKDEVPLAELVKRAIEKVVS